MFESFGFEETTAKQVSVFFALGLGMVFGLLAERTGFCFRRAVVAGPDRRKAAGGLADGACRCKFLGHRPPFRPT